MDIYRFFHPHFNPRLLNIPIRQQELNDLEQAACEFKKASQRLIQRFKRHPLKELKLRRLKKLMRLAENLESELKLLQNEHPGDTPSTLKEMVLERFNCTGWLAWANHVEELYLKDHQREHLEPREQRAVDEIELRLVYSK